MSELKAMPFWFAGDCQRNARVVSLEAAQKLQLDLDTARAELVTLERQQGDWTGRKCIRCHGHGEESEARSCASCGGTGDEWMTYKMQVALLTEGIRLAQTELLQSAAPFDHACVTLRFLVPPLSTPTNKPNDNPQ